MSLSFEEYGSGPVVLLMHGLFGSAENLRVIARGLEDRYRVILPDLPNHGNSPHILSSTHDAMVEAIEDFMRSESITEPVIGGHSIGGKLAMLLTLRDPSRFPALISIDMSPRRYEASHLEILAAMQNLDLSAIASRRDANEALSDAIPIAAVRAFLLKNLVRDDDGFRWRLNLDAISADYDPMLGWEPPSTEFTGPAVFIGGERSRYLQEDRDRDLIRQWFPSAQIKMIPDAGHWLHADKPQELLAVMGTFLQRLAL